MGKRKQQSQKLLIFSRKWKSTIVNLLPVGIVVPVERLSVADKLSIGGFVQLVPLKNRRQTFSDYLLLHKISDEHDSDIVSHSLLFILSLYS